MTDKPASSYDAVVIGTGIGGATFAWALAKRGLERRDRRARRFLQARRQGSRAHARDLFSRLSVIGGQTKAFGAAMYRLREVDFKAVEMEAGVSPAWPISYADLEPHYCEAEKLFKVHGSSLNDATEPPRSEPWPHDPIPHQGPVVELVQRVTEKAGVPVSYIPRAIDYDPQNGGKCVLCQRCDAYYCPRDAKMDAEIAVLRPAIETGRVTVLTKTECVRVLTTPDGKKVTGVQLKKDGQEFPVLTGMVGLGGGLRETPLILWRSRTGQHPTGLANKSGALGRHWASAHAGLGAALKLGVQKQGVSPEDVRDQLLLRTGRDPGGRQHRADRAVAALPLLRRLRAATQLPGVRHERGAAVEGHGLHADRRRRQAAVAAQEEPEDVRQASRPGREGVPARRLRTVMPPLETNFHTWARPAWAPMRPTRW